MRCTYNDLTCQEYVQRITYLSQSARRQDEARETRAKECTHRNSRRFPHAYPPQRPAKRRRASVGLRLHPAVGEGCRRWRGTGSSNPYPSSRQSVSLPQSFSKVENPAFRAGLGSWLANRSAETRWVFRYRVNRGQYLCRAIFQYRSADDGGRREYHAGPNEVGPSPGPTCGRSVDL